MTFSAFVPDCDLFCTFTNTNTYVYLSYSFYTLFYLHMEKRFIYIRGEKQKEWEFEITAYKVAEGVNYLRRYFLSMWKPLMLIALSIVLSGHQRWHLCALRGVGNHAANLGQQGWASTWWRLIDRASKSEAKCVPLPNAMIPESFV